MEFRLQSDSGWQPKLVFETDGNTSKYTLSYPCTNSYTCSPYFTTLIPGNYKFELYGASGGNALTNKGGKGGFSVGYYVNNHSTKAYFYIGGKGEDGPNFHNKIANTPGGFNGGGYGGYDTYYGTYSGGGGGGSTDIRIGSDKIEGRIIVAAGGGGACGDYNQNVGGNAGGTRGTDGRSLNSYGKPGGGASDKDGGSAYLNRSATAGILLYGGNASTMFKAFGGGGGGSGYYGGGGGSTSYDHGYGSCGSGGGGSGYIGGVWSSTEHRITAATSESTNEGNGYMIITYFGKINFHYTIVCSCISTINVYMLMASFVLLDKR